MKRFVPRLTYANVVATLALFLVVAGGSALAANQLAKNSVGSKQLKKNAVTSAKIKNGAITGAKVNLGSLGTVPNASHASTADTASNASAVGGQKIAPFFKEMAADGAKVTLFEDSLMRVSGTCAAGTPDVTAIKVTSAKGAIRWAGFGTSSFGGGNAVFPSTQDISEGPTGSASVQAVFEGGAVDTVFFSYRDDGFANSENCRFYGDSISG